jgi:3-oxoacyl-[acyl-carrier protein] reductase
MTIPVYPDLGGQVAVVTGGSRGIGAATCRALAANGVNVAVVGRDEAAITSTVDGIVAAQGQAIGVTADCTCEAAIDRVHSAVSERFGSVDTLAVFAGGNAMPVPTADEKASHWREVVESDLTSVFLTVSRFLPDMIDRRSGAILTMSSAAARQAADSSAAYAAAKGGVIAFSRHLAREIGPRGVRVNCIAPSAIVNDKMRTWLTEEQQQQVGCAFPLRRLGQPDDVAAAALFLVSSASSWITGVVLDIAGGMIMV